MKRISLMLTVLVILSCSNENKDSVSSYAMYQEELEMDYEDISVQHKSGIQAPPATNQPPAKGKDASRRNTKLIKNGSLSISTESIIDSKSFIDGLVGSHDAYYETDNYHASDYSLTFQLNIRVPSTHFESFISSLEHGNHQLLSKNISSRDVTEEFIDLEIRLDNNLAYLKRYNQLLAKAKTVKDMLEIQEKTRLISEEIETIKGRLKYLDNKVGYSTLSIQLSEELHPVERSTKRNFSNQILSSLQRGLNGMLDFIICLISIWPLILGIVILILSRKKIWSVINRKHSSKT